MSVCRYIDERHPEKPESDRIAAFVLERFHELHATLWGLHALRHRGHPVRADAYRLNCRFWRIVDRMSWLYTQERPPMVQFDAFWEDAHDVSRLIATLLAPERAR